MIISKYSQDKPFLKGFTGNFSECCLHSSNRLLFLTGIKKEDLTFHQLNKTNLSTNSFKIRFALPG